MIVPSVGINEDIRMVSYIVHCALECIITMSLYYEKCDDGYELEVLNPQFLNSIRGVYLSQSRVKKNTNAMQCAGMVEVVQCFLVIKHRHEMCFICLSYSLDSHLQWTT